MTLQRQIVLDESKENAPPDEGFIIVETEIEFLKNDSAAMNLWARGEVCEYVRVVCQARNVEYVERTAPRARLRNLLGGTIADKISSSLLTRILEIYERENPRNVAEVLSGLTGEEFWVEPPSHEHAARFLTLDIKTDIYDLAEAQRLIWANGDADKNLKNIYARRFGEREEFLREWLFDETTRKKLGEFPLPLAENRAAVLSEEIGRSLRVSEGACVTEFPQATQNKKIYAREIVEYFSHNIQNLTADRIAQIASLLSSAERDRLEKLLPTDALAPLGCDADIETALEWATEAYLPFRAAQNDGGNGDAADRLAASFADWLLENYPKMTVADRENSSLNLRTFYKVKELAAKGYWVLWAVIDGLSYLNHKELLRCVGEKSARLRVAEESRLFAVLPTITEKAKYGLTTGKFPKENLRRDWSAKNNFLTAFPDGVYASSTGMGKIADGLKNETPTVCYWNYLNIDGCFHEETDLMSIRHSVEAQVHALAAKINSLVESARDKNRVAVVVCSDHGQMTSHCRRLERNFGDNSAHGRTIIETDTADFSDANRSYAKSDDGETVRLNPIGFRLSEPTTVALGSTYFVDLKATAQTGAVGVHGGLYPEEAIVGLAVLTREPRHKKLSAAVAGAGETGNPGSFLLTIDNPNSATVNPLALKIENLEVGDLGDLLLGKVAPHRVRKFEIPIGKFPAANDGEKFVINGVLRYEFDDGAPEECAVAGALVCKTLYQSKNPSLSNRFKK